MYVDLYLPMSKCLAFPLLTITAHMQWDPGGESVSFYWNEGINLVPHSCFGYTGAQVNLLYSKFGNYYLSAVSVLWFKFLSCQIVVALKHNDISTEAGKK